VLHGDALEVVHRLLGLGRRPRGVNEAVFFSVRRTTALPRHGR
ncbi:hypothetical protein STIAU_7166, partial [Stigmatella aurantiaca DW4/3-1]